MDQSHPAAVRRRLRFDALGWVQQVWADIVLLARHVYHWCHQLVFGPSATARAGLVLFLALPQLYLLPPGHIDVSLATVVTMALAPIVLLTMKRRPRGALFWTLVLLLIVRTLTLLWSPEPRLGLQTIGLLGQFIVTLLLMTEALRGDQRLFHTLLRAYWPWILAAIGLVLTFRVLPGVEELFLRSVGGFFAGHNAVASFFGEDPNNVSDPVKSGGVFLNANVAAMFLGVNGLAALAISTITGSKQVRNLGIVALLAVPFTGSKSATVLAIVLPAAAVAVCNAKVLRRALRRPLVIATVCAGLLGAGAMFVEFGFVDPLYDAFVGRTAIWGFGAQAFLDNPILGLGYGGWEIGFPLYAAEHGVSQEDFPPHNLLLAAWAKFGIAGALLGAGFFVLVFRLAYRGLGGHQGSDLPFAAFSGAAFCWILIQGLGENTDIFGEIHLIPILSLLAAHLSLRFSKETS